MSMPVEAFDSRVLEAITRLEVKVENLEKAVDKLPAPTTVVAPAPQPTGNLPLSGGIAGLIAAAWTLYLQATGKT